MTGGMSCHSSTSIRLSPTPVLNSISEVKVVFYVGVDWAENHHMVCVMDEGGSVLFHKKIPDSPQGLAWLHDTIATLDVEPSDVAIGIETDHGLFVQALAATGYQVFPINPFMISRYRQRYSTSGKKSDPGDSKILADAVRTDRHNHHPLASNSKVLEALQLLTRAHQLLIQDRVRDTNRLRNQLRNYYPAALLAFNDLDAPDTLELLNRAATPAQGARLSLNQIAAALRRANRRNVDVRAAAIQAALRTPQLQQQPVIAESSAKLVRATVRILAALNREIADLEAQITELYQAHPAAEIYKSFPGIGKTLGPRMLAEMGDSPNRYQHSKARKAYAGTAPVTRASGLQRFVHRRTAVNHWLLDACFAAAECSLKASPGARHYYQLLRTTRGKSHNQAVRAIANHFVGCLHGCLRYGTLYDESIAWQHHIAADQAA
jgi:transposase